METWFDDSQCVGSHELLKNSDVSLEKSSLPIAKRNIRGTVLY
jgi:hypothetical protein